MFVLPPLNCKLLGQGLFLIQYLSSTSTTIFIRASLCSWHTNINSKLDSICFCNSSPLEKDSTPGSWTWSEKTTIKVNPGCLKRCLSEMWDKSSPDCALLSTLSLVHKDIKVHFPIEHTVTFFFSPHFSSLQKIAHTIYIGLIDWGLS